MEFQLIIALVKEDITDKIVKIAKRKGAPGSTILPARGTGVYEAKSFFGLEFDIQTDMVLFLLEKHLVDVVLAAICEEGQFNNPGTGVAFVLPVTQTAGLQTQHALFQKRIKTSSTEAK